MVRGVAVLAVVLAALVAASTASAQNELVATVSSGSITITHASGGPVTALDPGTYTLTVRDQTPDQNFHLSGPGVNIATEVEFVGTQTFTVTFQDGTYTYSSDADAYLNGTFRVGAPPPAPAPTPIPAGPNTLVATVGPGTTINLTRGGRRVTRLKVGTYTIVVRDRAAIHNFRLRGPGVNRATTVAFVGSRTWRLRLVAGSYRYQCDPHAAHLRGSFRVVR